MTEEKLKKANSLKGKIEEIEKEYSAFLHHSERKDNSPYTPTLTFKFTGDNDKWHSSIHLLEKDELWFIDLIAIKVQKRVDALKEELAAL